MISGDLFVRKRKKRISKPLVLLSQCSAEGNINFQICQVQDCNSIFFIRGKAFGFSIPSVSNIYTSDKS